MGHDGKALTLSILVPILPQPLSWLLSARSPANQPESPLPFINPCPSSLFASLTHTHSCCAKTGDCFFHMLSQNPVMCSQ